MSEAERRSSSNVSPSAKCFSLSLDLVDADDMLAWRSMNLMNAIRLQRHCFWKEEILMFVEF